MVIQFLSNEGPHSFPRVVNSQVSDLLKIFLRTTGPIATSYKEATFSEGDT